MFDFAVTDFKSTLGLVAGIISFSSYIIYIVSILRGKTKPSRISWFTWAGMGLVLALSYDLSGAANTVWIAYFEFLGPLLISLLSIKYGVGGLKDKTDLMAIGGIVLSVVLWIITSNPVVALVTNIVIDLFAFVPTIKKSWYKPEEEEFWTWFVGVFADTTNMFAIERPNFAILIYPIYILLVDVIIVTVLLVRGKKNPFIRRRQGKIF